MSRPWLQDDYKNTSKSPSQSPSEKKPLRVDQFGRTLPSRSRSRSRSRSGSRGRSRRQSDGLRHSRESSRSNRNQEGNSYFGRERSREAGRGRERGRRDSRERKRPRKRDGSSSSSDSDGSSGSTHTRIVASTKPKYLNARLFVANIVSKEVTKDELIKQFEKYGNVVDVLVHPKNYAFIQYLKEEHAKLAVEGEHGSTMKGWRLDVKMANENRKTGGTERGGPGGRGRGGDRGSGRGGRGFGSMERDRSPLNDDPLRDPYLDPFRAGGPRGPPPPPGRYPPGDFGFRDPYFPDPYRRGFPDPWIPDDPYRRDPYADPYRDPYAVRPPPTPVECEIFIVNSQLRAYGEVVERRVKEHNIITALSVIPEGRTAPQMIEELTAQNGLFAVFINPQNEAHRSLTLNILHGTPQEHRNMPLDDAIALVGRSFVQYVDGLREKANAATVPLPAASTTRFLPASPEVSYLLNLLADNRALTVQELNSVIKYLQERRDKLIDPENRPMPADDGTMKPQHPETLQSPTREQTTVSKKSTEQDLASKILSIFSSAGGSIQGVPPANGTQPPKPPTGAPAPTPAPAPAPAPPPPASASSGASIINFDNPNVQKALDNLIQSSPNLLKNINTTSSVSAAQMGLSSVSSSYGSASGMGYGQSGGMSTSQAQKNQNQGQMPGGMPSMSGQGGLPGMPNMPGQGLGYGGMQGQRMDPAGFQGGYNAPPPGQMGPGYGHPR